MREAAYMILDSTAAFYFEDMLDDQDEE
jgi:hypothetical protein